MNCALEDCLALDDSLDVCGDDWSTALPHYYKTRKPATDALAALALENYVEMRDKTVSVFFAAKSRVDRALAAFLPRGRWQPSLHTAVSFTSMPYHEVRMGAEGGGGAGARRQFVNRCQAIYTVCMVGQHAGCGAGGGSV
jgi:hypothetical protein